MYSVLQLHSQDPYPTTGSANGKQKSSAVISYYTSDNFY